MNSRPTFENSSSLPTGAASGKTQALQSPKPEVSLKHATWAGWLFLAGSLVLVVDAIFENLSGVTASSLLHLAGSLLFAVGSALLIPRRPR